MSDNFTNIKPPAVLTVKSLRKYLDDMEATWTDMDKEYMGEFEHHKINIEFPHNSGIGPAKIYYDGGLDFIVLPDMAQANAKKDKPHG